MLKNIVKAACLLSMFECVAQTPKIEIFGVPVELTHKEELTPQVNRYQSDDGQLSITEYAGAISGSLLHEKGKFHIKGSLSHPILEPAFGMLGNDMDDMDEHKMAIGAEISKKQMVSHQAVQDVYQIDIIVWVDELLVDELGYAGTRALAWEKVAHTNQVLSNSDVPIQIQPILIETMPMPEHDGTIDNLATGWFLNPHNGGADREEYRDKWGADLWHVIKKKDDDDGLCGKVSFSSNSDESSVIGVTAVGGNCPLDTFAHEVGHTLNAFHERESYDPNPDNPYWYAYACGGGASLMHTQWGQYNIQPFFSSPNKEYEGVVCGVEVGQEGHADNARNITENAPWKAGLKTRPESLTTVSIGASSNEVDESSSEVVISVTLAEALNVETSVELFVQNGTATVDVDYTGVAERLVFAPGETEKTVTLIVQDDSEFESDETIIATIQWPYRLTLSENSQQTIIIRDNDINSGEVGFSSQSLTASEDDQTVNVTLTRTSGSQGTLTVNVVTENGSATAGTDYNAIDQDIVFKDGEMSKELTVELLGDSRNTDRTFDLILSGEKASGITRLTVTIEDEEETTPPPTGGDNNDDSSGGGSMGWLVLIALLGRATLFRKQ